MTLGTIDNVRAISGWPTTDEIPDQEITDALDAATRRIVTMVGVEEAAWSTSPTSVNKPLADEAAEYCAASTIVMRIATVDKQVERAKQLRELCMESITTLHQALSTTEGDNPSFIDIDSSYTTYPLNLTVDPYDPNV